MNSEPTLVRSLCTPLGELTIGTCIGQRYAPREAAARIMHDRSSNAWHQYALHLITAGRGIYEDNDIGQRQLVPGVVFQRLPLRLHRVSLAAEGFEQWFLLIREPLFSRLVELGAIDCKQVVWSAADPLAVEQALLGLHRLLADTTLLDTAAVLAAVLSVLAATRQSTAAQDKDPITWACQILGSRLEENISPRQIAAAVGMDYERFRRRFRAIMGEAPGAFRMRQRMQRAETLIGMMPLKRVASSVGFSDLSSFVKQFRRYSGMTPGAFRQHMDTSK